MRFSFRCVLADGRSLSLDTDNLYEAPRRARSLAAVACFCRNPATGRETEIYL